MDYKGEVEHKSLVAGQGSTVGVFMSYGVGVTVSFHIFVSFAIVQCKCGVVRI